LQLFSAIVWLAVIFGILTVFIVSFFRNPERSYKPQDNMVISSADGKILKIEDVAVEGTIAGRFKKSAFS
jgi:hypothetical protein